MLRLDHTMPARVMPDAIDTAFADEATSLVTGIVEMMQQVRGSFGFAQSPAIRVTDDTLTFTYTPRQINPSATGHERALATAEEMRVRNGMARMLERLRAMFREAAGHRDIGFRFHMNYEHSHSNLSFKLTGRNGAISDAREPSEIEIHFLLTTVNRDTNGYDPTQLHGRIARYHAVLRRGSLLDPATPADLVWDTVVCRSHGRRRHEIHVRAPDMPTALRRGVDASMELRFIHEGPDQTWTFMVPTLTLLGPSIDTALAAMAYAPADEARR